MTDTVDPDAASHRTVGIVHESGSTQLLAVNPKDGRYIGHYIEMLCADTRSIMVGPQSEAPSLKPIETETVRYYSHTVRWLFGESQVFVHPGTKLVWALARFADEHYGRWAAYKLWCWMYHGFDPDSPEDMDNITSDVAVEAVDGFLRWVWTGSPVVDKHHVV